MMISLDAARVGQRAVHECCEMIKAGARRVELAIKDPSQFDVVGVDALVEAIGTNRLVLDYSNVFKTNTKSPSECSESSYTNLPDSPRSHYHYGHENRFIGRRGFDPDLYE